MEAGSSVDARAAEDRPLTVFRGLCAFPITPADEHGRVDTKALGRLLERLLKSKVDSIGLLGSTGTYAYLSRRERRRAIEAAASLVSGQTPVMVGIGALRTDHAIQFGRDAAEAGADAVLLAPMSYTPLTDEEVFTHFAAVSHAVGLPLCIYDNPGTTHFTFSVELLARLSALPNVQALKTPAASPPQLARKLVWLRSGMPEGFSVGYSVDANATEALLAGGDAWYSVLAGLFPEVCSRVVRAVRVSDVEAARALDAELEPVWRLFKTASSFRVMYAAANALGLSVGQPPRPILPLGPELSQAIDSLIERLQ